MAIFYHATRSELLRENAFLTLWGRASPSLLFLSLFLAAISFAQAPSGGIAGSVIDESGAVIPNVTLTISNPNTGLARVVTSGIEGTFAAGSLPPGDYDVRAEAPG